MVFMGSTAAAIDEEHKIVIQVSTADAKIHNIALDTAADIQNHYEPGEVKIEIIAYGAGLKIFTQSRKNKFSKRIATLVKSGIIFSACSHSIKKYDATHKKKIALIEGVKTVPNGAVRIIRLQEKGYSYLRP
jgi:hypothetical protein